MRKSRGFIVKDVLNDDAFHGRQRRGDMRRVRIGLREILALDVQPPEGTVERRLEHVRDAEAGLGPELYFPHRLEQRARGVIRDVAVTAELVWKRAHVARALDVVLPA